jgi:hypothetical protein
MNRTIAEGSARPHSRASVPRYLSLTIARVPSLLTDFAQRIGAPELAEQHGHELSPASRALGSALGGVPPHQCGKLGAGEMLEELIEQARYLYDCLSLLVGSVWRDSRPRSYSPTSDYRTALSLISDSKRLFWTTVTLNVTRRCTCVS